ncbi:hypothetical protein P8605_17270 [Streptomyces sp. T-3]|nr:hypothetical protein [Streptomyces sp. T-3]
MNAAALAGFAALGALTGTVFGAVPAAAGPTALGPTAAVTAAAPQPSAEPYCNYIDDSARPIIWERTASPTRAVPQVQCLINVYSNQPPLVVDGVLGVRTRNAIRAVQDCNHVSEPAGVLVGRLTWEVLYHPIPGCARQRSG